MRVAISNIRLLARDLRGLFDPVDALALIGKRLYKGSIRRAIRLIPIIYGSWYLADKLTPFQISPGIARCLAILVLLLPLIGLGLRKFAERITQGLIIEAEASGVNLTEDIKKTHTREHLQTLWTRVFAPEARLLYGDAAGVQSDQQHTAISNSLRTHLNNLPDPILAYLSGSKGTEQKEELILQMVEHLHAMRPVQQGALETSQAQFLSSALYAVAAPMPQIEQEAVVGFPLGLYEDWLDGALLHETDMKLYEQFRGHPDLRYARSVVRISLRDRMTLSIQSASARRWFQFACRSITREVGKNVRHLNDHCRTNIFDAGAILWPTVGVEQAIASQVPPEAVLAWRQALIHFVTKMLRDPDEDAERLIRRMHLFSFRAATELRIGFDPEYAAGLLGYNLASDCKTLRITGSWIDEQSRRARKLFDQGDAIWRAWKQDYHLLNQVPIMERRALRIAAHTGGWGMREALSGKKASPRLLHEAVARVRQESPRINRSLLNLRIHHQLTIFQIQEYRRHVHFLVQRALGNKAPEPFPNDPTHDTLDA